MPGLRRRPRAEAKEHTRQLLLDAAVVEFAREGYVGANINRISTSAGFAKGTIYNYFPSKRALMLALIDSTAEAHVDSIIAQVELADGPAQRLEQFFRAGFDFVEQQPDRAQLAISAVYGPDPEFRQRVYDAYDRLFQMLHKEVVCAGIACGEFRSLDADLAVALIVGVYLGSCSQTEPDGRIWLDPRAVASFVMEGLAEPAGLHANRP